MRERLTIAFAVLCVLAVAAMLVPALVNQFSPEL